MKSAVAACALLLMAFLAGCSDDQTQGPPTESVPVDRYAGIKAAAEDLPCIAGVGAGTSANLRLIAQANFTDGGGVGDIDIRDTRLASTRGIFDVSDPTQPKVLVDFAEHEVAGGGDVKWMSDNQSVVMGGGQVTLVNVADPKAPFIEDDWQFSEFVGVGGLLPNSIASPFLNAHMLYTAKIGDIDWVFVAPNSNTGVWILKAEGELGARKLSYVTQTLPVEGGPLGPHDMWVHQDEMTHDWLLYSADGFHGWTVFNVNNPASPEVVGGWETPHTGYTHTIQAQWINDMRVVATIQEVGVNFLEVYDATNLLLPILIGTWQVAPAETTPQHNINIVNGTLYMAHYSYGMYAFDLRELPTPPAIPALMDPEAHYDPMEGGIARPVPLVGGEFAALYDIVLKDGILYAGGFSEPVNGIHILAYGCNKIGDAALTSQG